MHWMACSNYFYTSSVVIGFSQVDYTIDEGAGTVMLLVRVRDGNIPEAENIIITLTTSDGTAQCMLLLVVLMKFNNTSTTTIHVIQYTFQSHENICNIL